MKIEDLQRNKIRLVVGGEEVVIDLAELFTIDETNLSQELAKQAALYAYFAAIGAEAERGMLRASAKKEEEYSVCDEYYRATEKSYTEGSIKAKVGSDEDYLARVEEEIDAKYAYRVMRAISTALEQRSSMLISLGAYLRHEMDMTNMSIRERKYDSAVDEAKSTIRKRRSKK